jgi:hypothetical protein
MVPVSIGQIARAGAFDKRVHVLAEDLSWLYRRAKMPSAGVAVRMEWQPSLARDGAPLVGIDVEQLLVGEHFNARFSIHPLGDFGEAILQKIRVQMGSMIHHRGNGWTADLP